ncbi:ABC transporter substrate-binding protein [Embleya sp. NPDC005971]|uniref:ABC transporter substrate-binding protein n=1 Tax=Embleya sp. NPDC005971 TaxID=3156724 RepID=UPI0033F56F1B
MPTTAPALRRTPPRPPDALVGDPERARVTHEPTRRRFGFGAGALTLAGLLAACGGTTEGAAEPTGTAGDTIRYTYGGADRVLPRTPRRAVTIQGRMDLELALLAGYPVIGSGNAWMPGARVGSQFQGITVPDIATVGLGDGLQVDYEQILRLDPDLIVMPQYGYEVDWYGNKRLEQMAPILGVSEDPVDWRRASTEQLTLLGRGEQARTHVAAYDEKLARLRPRLTDRLGGRRIVFGVVAGGAFSVWTRSITMSVAREVGLEPMFWNAADENNSFELSLERFDRLAAADVIIRQAVEPAEAAALDAQPTWQRIPAVANRKVVTMDGRYNAGLVLTATGFLDVLARAADLYA